MKPILVPGISPPRIARYFYVLRMDDYVSEFCVAGHADPDQTVSTLTKDGTRQHWTRREEGDLLVFRPPDGYSGGQALDWCYDRRLQVGEAMPRGELEKRSLSNRISA